MITIVARFKVQSSKVKEAEAALREMVEYVRRSEPGTLAYVLHKSSSDPTQLLMYEQYKDQASVDSHSSSDNIRALFAALGPILDGPSSIEMYEEIVGKR